MHKDDHTLAAQRSAGRKQEDGLWETAKVIIQALAIAFFVRTFFYQPFNIPSSSMYPTLKVGDYLFVSKLSYGYGKYSFNFALGVGEKNLIDLEPHEEGRAAGTAAARLHHGHAARGNPRRAQEEVSISRKGDLKPGCWTPGLFLCMDGS